MVFTLRVRLVSMVCLFYRQDLILISSLWIHEMEGIVECSKNKNKNEQQTNKNKSNKKTSLSHWFLFFTFLFSFLFFSFLFYPFFLFFLSLYQSDFNLRGLSSSFRWGPLEISLVTAVGILNVSETNSPVLQCRPIFSSQPGSPSFMMLPPESEDAAVLLDCHLHYIL